MNRRVIEGNLTVAQNPFSSGMGDGNRTTFGCQVQPAADLLHIVESNKNLPFVSERVRLLKLNYKFTIKKK